MECPHERYFLNRQISRSHTLFSWILTFRTFIPLQLLRNDLNVRNKGEITVTHACSLLLKLYSVSVSEVLSLDRTAEELPHYLATFCWASASFPAEHSASVSTACSSGVSVSAMSDIWVSAAVCLSLVRLWNRECWEDSVPELMRFGIEARKLGRSN